MSRQQGGIVLLTTMMMIVILTLLVLSLMQGVCLYIKSNNQIMTNHQVFHQMENLINRLDLTNKACVALDKNPNQLVDMLSGSQGCVVVDGMNQYRYVLDDLGLYPCLQISVEDRLYGSHHWLVTIASIQPPSIILQLRMAGAVDTEKCKLPAVHQIHSGIVSWRKLHFLLDRKKMHDKILS